MTIVLIIHASSDCLEFESAWGPHEGVLEQLGCMHMEQDETVAATGIVLICMANPVHAVGIYGRQLLVQTI